MACVDTKKWDEDDCVYCVTATGIRWKRPIADRDRNDVVAPYDLGKRLDVPSSPRRESKMQKISKRCQCDETPMVMLHLLRHGTCLA
jgi:hypothetical protein